MLNLRNERTAGGLLRFIENAVAPIALFAGAYLAALFVLFKFLDPPTNFARQTLAFVASIVATSIALWMTGRQAPWLIVARKIVAKQVVVGVVVALSMILATDLLIQFSSEHSRSYTGRFSLLELFVLLVVAAAHEELLLRGFVFDRLARIGMPVAVLLTAVVFSLMHFGNTGLTTLAMINLALGGLLLALLRAISGTLWLPLAFHWGWNAATGSLLGHEVSGFRMNATLFTETDPGPEMITGGPFGIEGSIFMTLVTTIAVIVAATKLQRTARRVEEQPPLI